ncbi:MAG TPA: hypothetical protein DEA08_37185 [Planctomycetes bacterium]|nr:hypothetical protein [Planctomycetota bacterium]
MSATREVEREGAEERRRSTPLSLKLGLAASALVVLALLAASIAWPSLKQRYVHPPKIGGLRIKGPPGAQVLIGNKSYGRVPLELDAQAVQAAIAPLGTMAWPFAGTISMGKGQERWEITTYANWMEPDGTHVFLIEPPSRARGQLVLKLIDPQRPGQQIYCHDVTIGQGKTSAGAAREDIVLNFGG